MRGHYDQINIVVGCGLQNSIGSTPTAKFGAGPVKGFSLGQGSLGLFKLTGILQGDGDLAGNRGKQITAVLIVKAGRGKALYGYHPQYPVTNKQRHA